MIEMLLKSGVWVEVYRADNLITDEPQDIASTRGLNPGDTVMAHLPDGTLVWCPEIVSLRFNR